jgi:hypothetical protein
MPGSVRQAIQMALLSSDKVRARTALDCLENARLTPGSADLADGAERELTSSHFIEIWMAARKHPVRQQLYA